MRSASAMSVQEEKNYQISRRAQIGPSHKSLTYFAIRPRRACDPNSWNEQSGSFGTVTAYQRQLYRCRTRWYAHLIKMCCIINDWSRNFALNFQGQELKKSIKKDFKTSLELTCSWKIFGNWTSLNRWQGLSVTEFKLLNQSAFNISCILIMQIFDFFFFGLKWRNGTKFLS